MREIVEIKTLPRYDSPNAPTDILFIRFRDGEQVEYIVDDYKSIELIGRTLKEIEEEKEAYARDCLDYEVNELVGQVREELEESFNEKLNNAIENLTEAMNDDIADDIAAANNEVNGYKKIIETLTGKKLGHKTEQYNYIRITDLIRKDACSDGILYFIENFGYRAEVSVENLEKISRHDKQYRDFFQHHLVDRNLRLSILAALQGLHRNMFFNYEYDSDYEKHFKTVSIVAAFNQRAIDMECNQ